MAAFRTDSELYYEKSLSDTMSDIEKAFNLIGKVQKISHEDYKIQGETRFGLSKVKIDAELEVIEGKTKVLFHGKGGDIQGVSAKAGIDNLIDTMENIDNVEFVPGKRGGKKAQMMVLFYLQVILTAVIGYNLLQVRFIEPGLLTFLYILWIGLGAYLFISKVAASKNK